MNPAAPQKFDLIQCGRAVAALMVVVYHASRIVALPRFYGDDRFAIMLQNLNAGVDFFFVLSGFIITWVHWGDIGCKDRMASYVRKRFLRIYPTYWGVLLPLTLLYFLAPSAGVASQRDPLNVMLSVFLLPNPQQPVLGVAWTLTYEVFFYALFLLVIRYGRALLWLTPVWAIGIIVFQGDGHPFWMRFLFNAFNINFIFGIWAGIALRRVGGIPGSRWLLGFGLSAFVAGLFFIPDVQHVPLVARLIFGLAAMLIVLGSVDLERRRRFAVPDAVMLAGSASYAIYLTHPVILSIAMTVLTRVAGRDVPILLTLGSLLIICTVFGILYHLLLEGRLIAGMKHLIDGRSRRGRTMPDGEAKNAA